MNTNAKRKNDNRHSKRWSKQEDEFLKSFYEDKNTSVSDIAKAMGRTVASVWNRGRHLGLWRLKRAEKTSFNRVEELQSVKVKEVPNFDDSVDICLRCNNEGDIKAFVKFKGGWNIDKRTHPFAMKMLKDIDMIEVAKDV